MLEDDAQPAAVGQAHAFAQTSVAAEAVEQARDGAGILAQFGGLALEAVNFLDHLDGEQHVVLLEREQGIGVVEQNVGIKNVILFHE